MSILISFVAQFPKEQWGEEGGWGEGIVWEGKELGEGSVKVTGVRKGWKTPLFVST